MKILLWIVAIIVFLILLFLNFELFLGVILLTIGYTWWETQMKEDIKDELREENRGYHE